MLSRDLPVGGEGSLAEHPSTVPRAVQGQSRLFLRSTGSPSSSSCSQMAGLSLVCLFALVLSTLSSGSCGEAVELRPPASASLPFPQRRSQGIVATPGVDF